MFVNVAYCQCLILHYLRIIRESTFTNSATACCRLFKITIQFFLRWKLIKQRQHFLIKYSLPKHAVIGL